MKLGLLFFNLILITFSIRAQDSVSVKLGQQKAQIEQLFLEAHGDMSKWLRGRRHEAQYRGAQGHPFWKTNGWIVGSLQTDRFFYPEILLKYDAYQDVLVYTPDSSSLTVIQLDPDQVITFSVLGKKFKYFSEGDEAFSLENATANPGFFQVIYDGNTQAISRNLKVLQKSSNDPYGYFLEKNQWFIIREGQFFRIKNKKNILEVFADKQEAMKDYLKKNKVSIGQMTHEYFGKLVAYYDSL